ncbi:MAG: hypothetical protein H0W76_19155 [Pyrinomonadaceae bacterium]|nr:hypothetical protein [Pyrinomonadaceae bacterium]
MKNEQASNTSTRRGGRMKFTFAALAVSFLLLVFAVIYASWQSSRASEANLPVPAMEQIALALRTFHHQTGRFPSDFRELNERVWRRARTQQISPDGKTLTAAQSNYFYTFHAITPANPTRADTPPKAAIWGAPVGERASESATYFWYVTPQKIEGWMGPALTRETVAVTGAVPSEQQLALLTMTRQTTNGVSLTAPKTSGISSFLPF